MILFAILGRYPLPENPIGPALINQYDGNQDSCGYRHDSKSIRSRGCIVDGEAPIRIEAGYHEPWKEAGKEGQCGGDNSQGTQAEAAFVMTAKQLPISKKEKDSGGHQGGSA